MEEIHENLPKKTRQGTINKVDRLSLLPDFILVNIISLLHLNAAARTCVLSHRWRHLWTHITRIHMDCFAFTGWPSYVHKYSFQSFTTIFTHILQRIDSSRITSFHLGCPKPSVDDENIQCSSYLGSWVPLICGKNPQEIKVTLGRFKDFAVMPMCVFQCTSLVKLELSGCFRFMHPGDNNDGIFNINLPYLKELVLRGIDIDLNFLSRIIKTCPLLETFRLQLEWDKNELVLDISGKNLKFFRVEIHGSSHRSKILIDAPNLEGITLQDSFVIYRFVHKLSGLKSASVGFCDFPGEDDYGSEISELVGGICNVGFLRIMEGQAILNPIYHSRPDIFEKFTNLTKLSLTCDLTQMENRTAPLPVCLLRWLKFVELLEINGNAIELKLVKYILIHANVLETLIIDVSHYSGCDREDLWSEFKFCDALFDMAESSSCSVQFQGIFITA